MIDDIVEIIRELEEEITTSMLRNLTRHEKEEKKEGFRWEQWQKAKLRHLKAFREQNEKLVISREREIEELANTFIEKEYRKGQNIFKRIWGKAKDFFIFPKSNKIDVEQEESSKTDTLEQPEPKEEVFFSINDKKIKTLQKSLTKDLKKAEHAIYRRADDIYKNVLYKTQIQLNMGGLTLHQAIDKGVKDFLKNGIDCVEYSDGKRVNIATYVEMALRTAGHRAKLLGEGQKRAEKGIYTVVVSAHANTCKLCMPWQGRILIDDVFTGISEEKARELAKETGYTLLSVAIKLGLLHPNCRHTITTFINPEITPIPVVPNDETIIENYQAQQKQRRIEVLIRKFKRIEKNAIEETTIADAKHRKLMYQKALREHLEEFPQLRRNREREKVRG